MALTIKSKMRDPGADFYYTNTWRLLVETHLVWLRSVAGSETLVIQPHIGYKYEGDLNGAMSELNIPPWMHWVTMRINGLYSSSDYDGSSVALMVPLASTLQQLAAIAGTVTKKIT
ncbi:hypothetical protein LUCX_76 [Xanthomonas phage vB_XciM_LucasX]|nr:hypothetical protein LUCX_76 [Xanthomonas phage vB_XciM_LucasX]